MYTRWRSRYRHTNQMIFKNDSRLRVLAAIKCYTQSGIKLVDLTDEEKSRRGDLVLKKHGIS